MTVLKRLRGSREVRISVDLGDCESSIARFAPQNLLVRLKSRRRQINKQQTQPTKVGGKYRLYGKLAFAEAV
jgi:hypothetical protein